MAKWFF